MLFDSHAHLDDERFDDDREKVINSLKENGVDLIVDPGADISSSVQAVNLSKEYENIYAAVGVHPHSAKDMNEDTLKILKALSKNDKVVAIGEIGLDYHYDNSPRDVQKKWFKEQIKLAKELNLPIIIHTREAQKDTFDIVKEEYDENLRGVLHCYSGSLEMAREYLDMGFYISFAGPITFKNSKVPKQVAKEVPLDKLLVETDCPYLTPEPHRGKRNEPLYVRYVASTIAELKGITFEEVARRTKENAIRFFEIQSK
jgi:TatD DNase family protein